MVYNEGYGVASPLVSLLCHTMASSFPFVSLLLTMVMMMALGQHVLYPGSCSADISLNPNGTQGHGRIANMNTWGRSSCGLQKDAHLIMNHS